MWYQQAQHQQSPTAPLSTVPQFLDNNQQLVAHFNQHSTSGPFMDGLNVTDASQFVSVIQQQQQQNNPHLQDGFNPATFFQQHHSHNVTQHHPTSHQSQSLHQHHNQQHQPPQLTCANVISASTTSSIDSLSLTGSGHVIVDSTTNGLIGLSNRTSVVGDQTALVMNTINNLRHHQQPRANITSNSNIDCNSNGNSNHRNNPVLGNCNLIGSKSMANSNTIDSGGSHNTINNNINSNNHTSSNQKSSNSKSKNSVSNKKDKSDNHRSSGSPRRIFSCPTCCKGFTEKFNMKRHMQIHSQSRPKYICNECSKSFAWKDNFIRHKKAAHGTSLPPYQV